MTMQIALTTTATVPTGPRQASVKATRAICWKIASTAVTLARPNAPIISCASFCCGSARFALVVLGPAYGWPNTSKVTLKDMGKILPDHTNLNTTQQMAKRMHISWDALCIPYLLLLLKQHGQESLAIKS